MCCVCVDGCIRVTYLWTLFRARKLNEVYTKLREMTVSTRVLRAKESNVFRSTFDPSVGIYFPRFGVDYNNELDIDLLFCY